MKLIVNTYEKRCDMGACGRTAEYAVYAKSAPATPAFDICAKCLSALSGEVKKHGIGKKNA